MIKNAFYLRHDNNARNHPKLLDIRAEFGLIAYAMYFFLLEMLDESESGKINLRLLNGVALSMSIEKDILVKFVEYAVELGLFVKDEDDNIFSKRILEDKEYRTMLSEAGKKGAKIKKARRDAKASLNPKNEVKIEEVESPPEAPLKPPLKQERREENRIEEESIKIEKIKFSDIFLKFPKEYQIDEFKAKANWDRKSLNDEEKQMAYDLVEIYIQRAKEATRRTEKIISPAHYLSFEKWNYLGHYTDDYLKKQKSEREFAERVTISGYTLKNPAITKTVMNYIKENLQKVSEMKYQMNEIGADKLIYDYGYDRVITKLCSMEVWPSIEDRESVVNVCRQWLVKEHGVLVGGKDPIKVLEQEKIMSN